MSLSTPKLGLIRGTSFQLDPEAKFDNSDDEKKKENTVERKFHSKFVEPSQCSVFFEPKEWSPRYASPFFTCDIVQYTVSPQGHALFDVLVKCTNASWTISKRFSEFDELLSVLRTSLEPALAATLPSLPAKTWTRNNSDDFLAKRLSELRDFLYAVLRMAEHKMCAHACIRQFLDLDHALPPEDDGGDEEYEDEDGADDEIEAAVVAEIAELEEAAL